MSRFVQVDRDTAYLLPPSVQEWLPEDHLARYVVDVVEALDLSALVRQYAGRGSDAHHPGTLLALLIYGSATGVHASRALERASYDSVMKFRQFLLRGVNLACGEWDLVCLAYNVKRMHRMQYT